MHMGFSGKGPPMGEIGMIGRENRESGASGVPESEIEIADEGRPRGGAEARRGQAPARRVEGTP